MRILTASAALLLTLAVGACLFEEPSPGAGAFVVPSGAVPVGVEGVYLASGYEDPGPLPQPSADESAPVIVGGRSRNTGPSSFSLLLEVASAVAIERVHLEIGARHYVITLSDGTVTLDACAILQDQQGYGCTKACVDACACVECDSELVESNAEGSCAVSCSTLSHEGGLSQAPYDGSETVFADVTYNGYVDPGSGGSVDGLLDSFPSCDGSVCADAAVAAKVVEIGFHVQDWSFLGDLDIGSAVAETPPTPDKPSLASNHFAAGSLVDGCAKPFSECPN